MSAFEPKRTLGASWLAFPQMRHRAKPGDVSSFSAKRLCPLSTQSRHLPARPGELVIQSGFLWEVVLIAGKLFDSLFVVLRQLFVNVACCPRVRPLSPA